MTAYVFENMSASDAANFTSGDRLTFSSALMEPDNVSAGINEVLGRIMLTGIAFAGGLTVTKTLTFDLSDFAGAPISFANGAQLFLGSSGDDLIRITNDANRNVAGGLAGNDRIEGGKGIDFISGGTGRDTLLGDGGDDRLSSSDEIGDYLDGGAGNDELFGNVGNDTLVGGDGVDEFLDSRGNDLWMGGPGDDVYYLENLGPTIVENPNEGIDTLSTRVPNIDLGNFANIEYLTYVGTVAATLTGNAEANIISADYSTNNLISGGQGDDRIQGGGTLNGNNGDDTLIGGSVMNGGEGNDLFLVSFDQPTLFNGGNGADIIQIAHGANFTNSQFQSIERIEVASRRSDRLQIVLSSDQMASLAGTVTFAGGAGNDSLIINAVAAGTYQLINLTLSNWTSEVPAFHASVWTMTGAQGDVVYLVGDQAVNYVLKAAAIHSEVQGLTGNSGNDLLIGGNGIDLLSGNEGNDTLVGDLGDDRLAGGAGTDSLDGGDGIDALDGGAGDDQMMGGAGADSLEGNDGNDTMDGGEGDDEMNGRAGHDILYGGAGADMLAGGDGNDHLYGQSANGGADSADSISGGDGSDYLQGNAGNDALDGDNGSDRINGGANNDWIGGSVGNDTVNGNLGNDTIDGGDDNDSLRGGQGDDRIIAGNGNDILSGDLGSDTLTGGGGNDVFTFSGQSSLVSAPDRITDYLSGSDHLLLGFAPVAVLTGPAQSTYSVALSAAQQLFDAHTGDHEMAAIAVGGDSYIFYSSSDGSTVDSAILLNGVGAASISANDFY